MSRSRTWVAGQRPPPDRRGGGLVAGATVLRGHLGVFGASLFLAVLQQLALLAVAGSTAHVAALAISGQAVGSWSTWLLVVAAGVFVHAGALWGEAWISHALAFRLLADIRVWLYRAFERLAPGGIDHRRSGDLASTAMADSERLELLYAHVLINLAVAVVVPAAGLAALAAIAPAIAVALLPWLLILPATTALLHRRTARDGRALREQHARVRSEVLDSLQGLREIVAFGRQAAIGSLIDRAGSSLVDVQRRHASRGGVVTGLTLAITAAGMLTVLVVAAELTADGRLTAARIPVVVVLAGAVFVPIRAALSNVHELGDLRAAADRVFALLDAPAPTPDEGVHDDFGSDADVVFEQVTFAYEAAGPPALADVSFRIGEGETVALVGRSGAGKSTAAALLLRHRDVGSGAIRIGGIRLDDVALSTLRETVAYVPQEVFLFHDTIAGNLRLAAPDATDHDLEDALRRVGAWDMVRELPEGLGTLVGDRGTRLSGGQRQRLALARSLLRDARVLVLDEAASHLDLISERDLQRAIAAGSSGRASLIIAHRLSTILSADRIVLLDRGRVVDSGEHRELLGRCHVYRELVRDQLPVAG